MRYSFLMVVIEEGVSLAEVEEALRHVSASLKVDKYGDRMNFRKRTLYLDSIDDLLDQRNLLTSKTIVSDSIVSVRPSPL